MKYAIFDITTSHIDELLAIIDDTTPATHAQLEDILDGTTLDSDSLPMTDSVLSYTAGVYNEGVTPMVYNYWGAGAPAGAKIARRVAQKYTGYVKETGPDNVTLILGGSGFVQVHINTASSPSVRGYVGDPLPEADLKDVNALTTDAGYRVIPLSLSKGDKIEIYHFHTGEAWGGVFCKVLPFTLNQTWWDAEDAVDPDTGRAQREFRKHMRDAPVLGASYAGSEVSGDPLASIDIPYLISASLNRQIASEPELELVVSLNEEGAYNGFYWDETTRCLVDNLDANTKICEERRVSFEAGYASPGELKDAQGDVTSETYQRFLGHVREVVPQQDKETAIILCRGFEGRLLQTFDENLPDRLSYHANAFIFHDFSGEPVWAIPAFDNWPLEVAIAEMCHRSGIDSYYLGRSAIDSDPNHGKHLQEAVTTATQQRTFKYFASRLLGDPAKKLQIERQIQYGNVGLTRQEELPPDDEYLFSPEITNRLYDRVTELAEHHGYDFRFNAEGQALLRTRIRMIGLYYRKPSVHDM
jgi:hypothetical protein